MTHSSRGPRLRRLPDLHLHLRSDGRVLVDTGALRALFPSGALAVLDRFTSPCTLEQALDGLGAASAREYATQAATALEMLRAGILEEEAAPAAPHAASGFDDPRLHVAMLDDRGRTAAFLQAIAASVRPDDVVLDLGAGTGVLSVAAARAGARRVYAVERGAMARHAREIAAKNGFADRVEVIQAPSTAVVLPERATLVISETLGDDPFEEGILESLHDARERLTTPDARVLPRRVTLGVRVVELPPHVQREHLFTRAALSEWRAAYDVDFSPLAEYPASAARLRVPPSEARTWRPVGGDAALGAVELAAAEPAVTLSCTLQAPGARAAGVLLFFDAELAPGAAISTHPERAAADTHWLAPIYLLPHDRPESDQVRITYTRTTGQTRVTLT